MEQVGCAFIPAFLSLNFVSKVLWPYLLELVIPGRFTGAVAILSKCIAHLAAKKRQAEDDAYIIDFTKQGSCPQLEMIFV